MESSQIRIRDVIQRPGIWQTHSFFCPACNSGHGINIDSSKTGVDVWQLSGTPEKPTISPSVLVRSGNENGPTICHSFINEGKIQFLGDCTHKLAGQTVDLPTF